MPGARFEILRILLVGAGLSVGAIAQASLEPPMAFPNEVAPSPVHPSCAGALSASATPEATAAPTVAQKISSYYEEIRGEVFSKLRPVQRDQPIDFNQATALLQNKTINEQIFNKNFESKMRGQYAGQVAPYEKTATNPIWRASSYEMQQYENGRHNLAQWTTKEVMDDELKEFFAHADKDSSAMKAISTARSLSGGDDGSKPAAAPVETPEQKAAREHRTDLPRTTAVVAQEESIPTNLKTKVNVLKQNGSIVFSNPVAITTVNGSRDDVSMNMTREFRKLALRTNASFGMKDEVLNVNVNKKVVDHVSLDLDHFNYAGTTRGASGEKTREQAKVNYSITF